MTSKEGRAKTETEAIRFYYSPSLFDGEFSAN
jgi:hypothetical protein